MLILVYQWDVALPDQEASRLAHRAIAYISCAIYDAASVAELSCQLSKISNGRRPAWVLDGDLIPISLTLSDIDISDKTCQMTIAAMTMIADVTISGETRWTKLLKAFKATFSDIRV